jgi:hypothetical protein
MFQLNGQLLGIDVPFTTEDGTSYPANWLRLASPEERAAIGITEVADPESYDDRFYWGVNNPKLLNDREESDEQGNPLFVKVLGEVNGEPAMVDSDKRLVTKGLKSTWSAQIKDTTNKLLAATDWMVIRKAERDVAIPADTVAYRAAVLTECDRLLAAIAGAADVAALAFVLAAQNWPVSE